MASTPQQQQQPQQQSASRKRPLAVVEDDDDDDDENQLRRKRQGTGPTLSPLLREEAKAVGGAVRAASTFFGLADDRKDAADHGRSAEKGLEHLFVSHQGLFNKKVLHCKTSDEAACEAALVAARWALLAAAKRVLTERISAPLRDELLADVDTASHLLVCRQSKLREAPRQVDSGLLTLVVAGDVLLLDGPTHHSLPEPHSSAAVMVGAMLERITNGALAATHYCVGPSSSSSDASTQNDPHISVLLRLRTNGKINLRGDNTVFDAALFQESFVKDRRATPVKKLAN